MSKTIGLVYGVGLNDANYAVKAVVNGKRLICPYYKKWSAMLARCYSAKYQGRQPTYTGCSVCEDWLTFSNFKAWMEAQEWQGNELDKDLLFKGNKIYSPKNCVFLSKKTNSFTTDSAAIRGEWPIGVNAYKRYGKYQAQCCNPFSSKREHLGYFACPNEAHEAWRRRKHELACQLAEMQSDERVAAALRIMYSKHGSSRSRGD